ncbi:prephenate dehydrogenase/arogenate dehydrogenase family protein [Streptomyces prasinus]|uniref:Prephenate dehydrogenase/arogenate dehydrogenase family protein n=2 Tax=Streptomyces prasinus TaxID=67345 RepID=A0ABX6B6T1_9ACTN|nr:prephenate dehydrogenase/arogenate dehydrogenase family protein [Streptomyces prasinus]
MFTELLTTSGSRVCTVDTAQQGSRGQHLQSDIKAPDGATRTELSTADVVLLAVSEKVALAALPVLAGIVRPDALLVDTLSVKSSFSEAVRRVAPGHQAIGLNPMFAPSLGLSGRPVATVVHHDGPLVHWLLELVRNGGGRVVAVEASEHDRLAAASQALTHAAVLAFGAALAELDVDLETLYALAPPPHAVMLALLARIVSGTPEVYWDVQAGNPLAPEARKALSAGVRQFDALVAPGFAPTAEADFAAALDRIRAALGGRLGDYSQLCTSLFARLPQPPEETPGVGTHT